MITIKDFCEKHGPCQEGIDWAMSQGVGTMSELWALDMRPGWRIWIATREGAVSPHKQRLFVCFCARQVWPLLTDPRSRRAIDTAERHAAGQATDEELAAAHEEAREAWVTLMGDWTHWIRSHAAWVASMAALVLTSTVGVQAAQAAARLVPAIREAEKAQAQWLIDNINKGEIA